MALQHLNTGTAADLLTFDTFYHVSRNMERLTRVATASEEWIVSDWDREMYVIRFDNNFSKKHLFTFCKDRDRTITEAEAQHQHYQAQTPESNWHNAEIQLLINKLAKNLDKRAVTDLCSCNHLFTKHQRSGGSCTHEPCECTRFRTPYGLARRFVQKPVVDPLEGAKTTKNTCIILNLVPKSKFETVVVRSIQAHEKPSGWVAGDPLSVNLRDEKILRWDFGQQHRGAVKLVEINLIPGPVLPGAARLREPDPIITDYQGCYVSARKTGTDVGKQTWTIYHMCTTPSPFRDP